jgi:cytochrome c556
VVANPPPALILLSPMSLPLKSLLVVALAVVVALGARAGEPALRASKPEVKKEIVAVIEAQLAAFRRGDAAEAYRLAAAELRAQKPLRVFTSIVQRNYPEIWANTRAEFGIARDDGARATVPVQVYSKTDDAGYDFTLVREPAGWRIIGVLRHEPKKTGKV